MHCICYELEVSREKNFAAILRPAKSAKNLGYTHFVLRMRAHCGCWCALTGKELALLCPRQVRAAHGLKHCMRYRRLIVVVAIIMAVSVLLLFSLLTVFSTSQPTDAKKGPLVTNKVRLNHHAYDLMSKCMLTHAYTIYLVTL